MNSDTCEIYYDRFKRKVTTAARGHVNVECGADHWVGGGAIDFQPKKVSNGPPYRLVRVMSECVCVSLQNG